MAGLVRGGPMIDASWLRDLLGSRVGGFGLPGVFYRSEELFELDMRQIFGRHWIFVAVEAEVPNGGDFVTIYVGEYGVIILRDKQGQLRAFHNVCRHRGSQLIEEEKGSLSVIVCKYHRWSYSLKGALLSATHAGGEIDRSCYPLRSVHIKSVSGLIFICLADEAPSDIEEFSTEVTPYLGPHDLRNCKVAKQVDCVEEGNWKLTIENNRECQHCAGHPELTRSLFHFIGSADHVFSPAERQYHELYESTRDAFIREWSRLNLPWRALERVDDRVTGFRTERLALAGAGESSTVDTRAACRRLLGDLTHPKLGSLHLHTQPNSWHHFFADHAVTFAVLPLSVDRTLLRTTWLVHKDAVEGVDYEVDNLTSVWRATNAQDANFVKQVQAGVISPGYRPGPLLPSEYLVDKFLSWYVHRLRMTSGIGASLS